MSARQLRTEVINHISDQIKAAFQAVNQAEAALVTLGWQHDNYVNRQTGQRVTIQEASAVLGILARHLAGAKPCAFDGCENRAAIICEHCEVAVCEEHGTRGGDRQVQDVGAVAYPSACYQHGGFNADA